MTIKNSLVDEKLIDDIDPLLEDVEIEEDLEDEDDEDLDTQTVARERFTFIDTSKLIKPETLINNKKLYIALTSKDFENYVFTNVSSNENYLNTGKIAYDIETNAEDPKSANAKIIGFSVSFSENTGIYIVRESLDFVLSDSEWDRIIRVFKVLMKKSKHIIVHNRKYENPYTINCMGYEIKNDVIEDTMIKCRILFTGEAAGLKPAAARLLGYADWDSELAMYTKAVKNIINTLLYLKAAKKLKAERFDDNIIYEQIFRDKTLTDTATIYANLAAGNYRETEFVISLMSVLQVLALNDLIETPLFGLLIDRINEIVELGGLETDVIPYSMIPMKIISKYGALDAIATYELNTYCDSKFDERSQSIRDVLHSISGDNSYDYFDFRKGYEGVKAQFDAGINLEMSGAHWDDDVASKEYVWLNRKAIDSWFNLFDNQKFASYIKEKNKLDLYNKIIVDAAEELNNIPEEEDYTKVVKFVPLSRAAEKLHNFFSSKGTNYLQKVQVKFLDIIVDNGDTGTALSVRFNRLYETYKEELEPLFEPEFEEMFNRLVSRDSITVYSDLKKIFNPAKSTKEHFALINTVLNSEDLRFAELYVACVKESGSNRYWENPVFITPKTQATIKLFAFIDAVKKHNGEESVKAEPKFLPARKVFKTFKEYVSKIDLSEDLRFAELYNTEMTKEITAMRDDIMIKMHQKFKYLGVEIEDESTWTPEYAWLVNFRSYKKSVKMITSSIIGSVGRKSVTVVDKNAISDLLPKRIRKYNDVGTFNPETEDMLLSVDFGICTAETGRWRSGIHTIPAGSTIKNIYTSRYTGGIICSPDYSQMEVRALAAIARETTMLEAFMNNEDIHKKTAMAVYQKRKEDITSAERGFSKAVTFAILYGSSVKSVAEDIMGGDVQRAQELFDKYYLGYPKLKTWIDTMHKLWDMTGYVTLMSNRLIMIPKPDKHDEKYNGKRAKGFRCSQNYPIQGFSNDIAGVVLFKIIEYVKENNFLSKAFSFVHDALYFDIHPLELFEMIEVIAKTMNEYPMQEYQVPATADIVLGISMGQELKATEITHSSNTVGSMVLSGPEEDFNLLIENWKKVYKSVEWVDEEEPKPVYVPKEDLFTPKKNISYLTGTHRLEVTRKVNIVIS